MKILYFGNGLRGEKCLQVIVDHCFDVIAVVTLPSKDSSLAQLGRRLNLPVYQPERVNAATFLEEVRRLRPSLCVLSGYNQILKSDILSIPRLGTINLHGGKLPEFRGVAPINWQIIKGETEGGCAILYVDEGIDTGDIIAQEYYAITSEDNAATIVEKTLEIFPRMLLEVLKEFSEGKVNAVRQNAEEGCYYTRRYPRDGRIDWKSMTDVQVHNLVRALVKPYPGAFTYCNESKIYIWKTSLLDREIKGIAGRIPLKIKNGAVAIAANQALVVEEISIEDSNEIIDPREYFNLGDDLY